MLNNSDVVITWRDFVAQFPEPRRVMAPFPYYGGKGHLARRIVPLLPRGQVYVEPFCGAASVFWHLPKPYPVMVLNDLDANIISVFRALQDQQQFEELAHRLTFTPYSRAEFVRALQMLRDDNIAPIDKAWATMVVAGQSINGNGTRSGDWSRAFVSSRDIAKTASAWRSRLRSLQFWHDRLLSVQLDCRDAVDVIQYWDSTGTVFYLDPPYPHGTRAPGSCRKYRYEMTDEQHNKLIDILLTLKGKAILSGYRTHLYERLDWPTIEIRTACHTAARTRSSKLRGTGALTKHAPRTEVLWISPSCGTLLTPICCAKDEPVKVTNAARVSR